jgi:long-chain acyl-CoA synthetase
VAENFVGAVEAAARARGAGPSLAWEGGTLAWPEILGRSAGAARGLAARGVRRGDRVALVLPNGWPFVVALLGGLRLGATVTPLHPMLTAEERTRILDDLRPAAIVERVGDATSDADAAPADGTAPALVLYTSGSTGRPKGSVLSHAALMFANHSWAGPVMALTPADVVLGALPLSHSFGLNGALLAPLLAGATAALVEHFTPEGALAAIARHRVTVLPAVATMFRRLLDCPALATTNLSALRVALSGAAPCPWELAREWRARTGVRILRGYGSTELFRPISYLAEDPRDEPDAIGVAVPGVEVRVVDDDGAALSFGQVGELAVRSPAATDGYLGQPEETRAVLVEGWFRTGDLAAVTSDGLVRIVGRKKELILRGGYSVVPGEVEAALASHPAVAEAAVVGIPHAELGEEVSAFVTLRAGARADPAELIAHCRERLAGYKYPRRVTILSQLPRGATGKVLKSRLPAT